jgi:tetratricopeptide (TPR) repeat protein
MLSVLWLALATTAAPADLAAPTRFTNLSAVDVFAIADRARVGGEIKEAITLYDALAKDPNPEIRAEARFRKGMMLADAGRHREAAQAFRSLLDEKPNAIRARLELARMLAAIGDEAAARRELRQVQAAGLPPEVAETVGKFDQILRSRKRLGGTFELALAPDTNINRATQARTLDTIIAPLTLSDDARAKSGVGAHVAGQAYARFPLTSSVAIVPRVSGLANIYRDHAFNDISGSALLGLEWQRSGDRLSPSVGRTWRWYGGRLYARTDAITMDWLHSIGRRSQFVASGSVSHADYLRNELQDGAIVDLSVSFERALTAESGASLTLSATRQTARDAGYATKAGGLTALTWRDVGKITLFASVGLRRTEGDAALFLFGERRREWLVTARGGATFRKLTIGPFAPFMRVAYERNRSSLQLYAYRRLATEFGFTRAF